MHELIDSLKEFKRRNSLNIYNNTELFRAKASKLIVTTPTGDLRNELTNLSIIFENIISDYLDKEKIKANIC